MRSSLGRECAGLKWLGKLVKEEALGNESSADAATSTLEKLRSKGALKEDVRYGGDDTGDGAASLLTRLRTATWKEGLHGG
jgi:hypothetical protein